MTAKQLIKVLEAIGPDAHVVFGIGGLNDDEYRDDCAKVQLQGGECLDYLHAERVEFNADGDGETVYANIILGQSNWPSEGFRFQVQAYNEQHKV